MSQPLGAAIFLSFFVAASSLPSPAQTIDLFVPPASGPQNVYAGNSAYIEIGALWRQARDFTVDLATNRVSAPGHTFTNGAGVWVSSTGKLPAPLTMRRFYSTCEVSGDSFVLVPAGNGCAPKVLFTSKGSGTLKIGAVTPGPDHIYLSNVQGLPPGVSLEVWCEHRLCLLTNGKPTSYSGTYYFTLRFIADRSAPVSSSIISVTIEGGGQTPRIVSFPLNVNAAPAAVTYTPPTSAPPIPGRDAWEKNMKALAAKWCTKSNPGSMAFSFGVETQVWYYDGALVYYNLADYLNDPSWNPCAENIAKQYRDNALSKNGVMPLWRTFTRGLSRASKATGDPLYREAVSKLVYSSPYAARGGGVRDDGIRETAYFLDSQVNLLKLTGERWPMLDRTVDFLLGMFDSLFVSNNFIYEQVFMDGLALRALIDYYDVTKDPRIPPAVKKALDSIWARSWSPSANKLFINPEPLGPRCEWGCKTPEAGLMNLTAPAFAWYWALTGDDVYRQRGDAIFSHSMDDDIDYSGKIFSQNYTWSFDYVRWRELKPPTSRAW